MEIIQNAAEFYIFQPEMSVVGPDAKCRAFRFTAAIRGIAEVIETSPKRRD
jgi:hypothetical protein